MMKVLFVGFLALLPLSGFSGGADEPNAARVQGAQQAELPSVRKRASQQLAKFRVARCTMWMNPGGFDILTIKAGSETPAKTLYNMGLDVLPALVDALDDNTPTAVVEPSRTMGEARTWRVNELVARLIVRIAQHRFVIGEFPNESLLSWHIGKHPNLVPQFKRLVLAWYEENRDRTLEERKIADVSDPWFRNRLDAVEWLGEHKVFKARLAIVQYIDSIFASKERNSLRDAEMAESALALGQIGDKRSLPEVQRVCEYLARRLKEHGVTGSMDVSTLFQAYQGRALLGEKFESLQELHALYDQCAKRMEALDRNEYQERMKKAEKW
jgi:hypothetical protein